MKNETVYLYEMHVHTARCSGGGADIRDHIDALRQKGYSGMVVTNHFYYGDTVVDRSLSWEKFVDAYREDYLEGLSYAKSLDFDLLFGLEEHVGEGREILIYGITPDFIAAHPELKMADAVSYLEAVHTVGGLVYQAHPYRDRWYIQNPTPLECLSLLDGLEVYNAANDPEWNESAQRLADELGLACIGGSDGHSTNSVGRSGIAATERIRTGEDLVRVLKEGKYTVIKPNLKSTV